MNRILRESKGLAPFGGGQFDHVRLFVLFHIKRVVFGLKLLDDLMVSIALLKLVDELLLGDTARRLNSPPFYDVEMLLFLKKYVLVLLFY